MSRNRKILVGFVFAACALAVALATAFYAGLQRFADAPLAPLPKSATLDVAFGTPLPGIVRDLDARGIRSGSPLYWRLLARRMGVAGKLHAGEYALDPGIAPRGLLEKMAAGDVVQHKFTIVEGWTFAQLRDALARDPELERTLIGRSGADIMRALGSAAAPPEGWFLPETYQFVKGMSDLDILRRAHAAMRSKLDALWAARAPDLPLDTPYQALILASIVEKETAQPAERALIAGVFERRLKLGMRLQTDPAVIYGLGSGYDGKIHTRDLETDTPYNTYTRAGLPPTPIAMPGSASLEAVLHPAPTDALYFVARGDGTHAFSATLEAHNRAVAKYQLHRP
ncbi:MAG: endolytic transglycosylase MltG [Xanthomonadaceae bacterium]|nr:endolytic transglycosylase MltG [Xanthomonadaceae bacterium]